MTPYHCEIADAFFFPQGLVVAGNGNGQYEVLRLGRDGVRYETLATFPDYAPALDMARAWSATHGH